jgi:C1A family cysteine protease
VNALRLALANDSPVAFSVPVYAHWWKEPTQSTGDVRLPLPGEKVEGGHAMCMVGYETDLNVPGGGYFLVRNSWGEGWGWAGYARLPFAYINRYGTLAYIARVGTSPESLWQRLRDWIRNLFG